MHVRVRRDRGLCGWMTLAAPTGIVTNRRASGEMLCSGATCFSLAARSSMPPTAFALAFLWRNSAFFCLETKQSCSETLPLPPPCPPPFWSHPFSITHTGCSRECLWTFFSFGFFFLSTHFGPASARRAFRLGRGSGGEALGGQERTKMGAL